ncbi:MAG: spore maturation protein [Clostridia bacterium]|nr:spore maturation protein [Clostridia bacterium]MDE7328851.1 spore maturation protein [Clostridia bacterium]
MNLVFAVMILVALVMLVIVSPESAFTIMIGGASSALKLAFTLIAIYAIWLSVLSLMDGIGLNKAMNKIFRPITKLLFKGESDLALEYITLNFSANLLGMGGAATPLGIKAMECMQDGSEKATDNMILFMVINSTSIQLIPATIIGLRAAAGSNSASDIILPSLLATIISTVTGVILAKICAKFRKKEKQVQDIEPRAPLFVNAQKRSAHK